MCKPISGQVNEVYKSLCNGSLHPVLNTLKRLKQNNVWLEITNLLIPGYTDDEELIKIMCGWLVQNGFEDTPLHFSRFFPNYKLRTIEITPLEKMEQAFEIAKQAGMQYVYLGNISGHTANNTYCPVCKQELIIRDRFQVKHTDIVSGYCNNCKHKIAGVFE